MVEVPQVALINESSVLTDAEVAAWVAPLQHQVHYDFKPYWGQGCHIYFVPKGGTVISGSWEIHVLDNSDQAGALGYHYTTSTGQPLAKVFAATDQKYNLSASVTTSHELLEMLADPHIARGEQISNGNFYALEVGDPVEDDSYGYTISGVLVSDFITEAWFDDSGQTPGPYDFQNHLTRPLQVLPNGYVSIWNGSQWTQKQQQEGELVDVPLEADNPRFTRVSIRQSQIQT